MKQAQLERLACHIDQGLELYWSAENVVRLPSQSGVGKRGLGLKLGGKERDGGSLVDAATVGKGHADAHTPDGSSDGRFRYQFKCVSRNGEWGMGMCKASGLCMYLCVLL